MKNSYILTPKLWNPLTLAKTPILYSSFGIVNKEITSKVIFTIITVSDIVSLDTPPKNDAAPTRANAPGSIQPQYDPSSAWTPKHVTIKRPMMRPYIPPVNLKQNKHALV